MNCNHCKLPRYDDYPAKERLERTKNGEFMCMRERMPTTYELGNGHNHDYYKSICLERALAHANAIILELQTQLSKQETK